MFRSLYTDYSLDKLSRDGRMFKVRDEMIAQVNMIFCYHQGI